MKLYSKEISCNNKWYLFDNSKLFFYHQHKHNFFMENCLYMNDDQSNRRLYVTRFNGELLILETTWENLGLIYEIIDLYKKFGNYKHVFEMLAF